MACLDVEVTRLHAARSLSPFTCQRFSRTKVSRQLDVCKIRGGGEVLCVLLTQLHIFSGLQWRSHTGFSLVGAAYVTCASESPGQKPAALSPV